MKLLIYFINNKHVYVHTYTQVKQKFRDNSLNYKLKYRA